MGACLSATPSHKEDKNGHEATKKKEKQESSTKIDSKATPKKEFVVQQNDFINEKSERFVDNYKVGKVLGAGGFGEVRICTRRTTGAVRAVKILKKDNYDEESKNLLLMEIDILKKMDHPNIVRLYEFYQDKSMYYLVFEVCNGGELFDKIIERNYFSEKEAAIIMKQLFSVVHYCHQHQIVHRDLKPENLLLDDKSNDLAIKVIDFGTSQSYGTSKKMTQKVGTPYYIAPEVLKGNYDEKCDEWSSGVILYILLTGKPPFGGANNEDIIKNVQSGSYSVTGPEFKNVSKEAVDLIKKLLTYDAKKRITAEQALSHSWIQKYAVQEIDTAAATEALGNLKQFRAEEKLQQATIAFMVGQLVSKEEMAELQKAFKSLDSNSDGKLSKDELLEGYRKIMGEAAAEAEVERIMEAADADGSGNIDYSEFVMATINKKKLFSEEKLETAFKLFDKDGNGFIQASELKAVLGVGKNYDEGVWGKIVGEVDKNGDGKISYAEFKVMMEKCL